MEAYRQMVNFSFVIMLGDNIYGGDRSPVARKFEQPYRPLLDAGVKFYASLGNHENPDERQYKLLLDSTYMSPEQLSWLEGQLRNSNSAWKSATSIIPFIQTENFTDRTVIYARGWLRFSRNTE